MKLVTSNIGKYNEYKEILAGAGIEVELVLMKYPEEQLDTIEEVAQRSAEYLTGIIRGDFLIDDSGLFIESLGGFPGVYSSYVNRTLGNAGILKLLNGEVNRKAVFRTCIAYFDERVNLFLGETDGSIAEDIRGKNGFGFDPIFIPEGKEKTYAEMSLKEKNSVSHRSKALMSFLLYLEKKEI